MASLSRRIGSGQMWTVFRTARWGPPQSAAQRASHLNGSDVVLNQKEVELGSESTRDKGSRVERWRFWITRPAWFSDVKSLLETTQDYFFSFIYGKLLGGAQ